VASLGRKREGLRVGGVVVTYKIFPTDITVSFDELKKRIEASLPKFAEVYGYGEEPVAFGLKVLLAQFKFPEDQTGVLEEFEKRMEKLDGVSQMQTINVRRTSR
jgi:translation elongation factor aEF-1 beta